MIRYAKPRTLQEALSLLGEAQWKILAGGTDFYPSLSSRPLRENVLDINALDELRGISQSPTHVVIGARTTWTDIVRHPLPPAFDALKQVALEVGSRQIQNVASIAGNLCNASPAADGAPALMVLDAEVGLQSGEGERFIPLDAFLLGNRKTALRPGEIVTTIRIPKPSCAGVSAFIKLGARRYLVISIAMAAVRLVTAPNGEISTAAISVGACSAVAQRLRSLESALTGAKSRHDIGQVLQGDGFPELSPIDDIRASAAYRKDAAREIVERAIFRSLGRSGAEVAA